MDKIGVVGYQKNFKRMTKKLFEERPDVYKIALVLIRIDELQNEIAYMIKQNKPNNSGTKITFRKIESLEQYEEELNKLREAWEASGLLLRTVKKESDHDE